MRDIFTAAHLYTKHDCHELSEIKTEQKHSRLKKKNKKQKVMTVGAFRLQLLPLRHACKGDLANLNLMLILQFSCSG